jgi:phosphoglycerate kinase
MSKFSDFNFKGKKALLRVDFNVPLDKQYQITDDTRITATIPTIKKILDDGGSVILMSHFGRPKDGPTEKFSLKHIVNHLSKLLGGEVQFANDSIGEEALQKVKTLIITVRRKEEPVLLPSWNK